MRTQRGRGRMFNENRMRRLSSSLVAVAIAVLAKPFDCSDDLVSWSQVIDTHMRVRSQSMSRA
jgi:hypothetical protein